MSFAHTSLWHGINIQCIFIDQLDKGNCSPTAYNLKSKWKGEELMYCPIHFPFRETVVNVFKMSVR